MVFQLLWGARGCMMGGRHSALAMTSNNYIRRVIVKVATNIDSGDFRDPPCSDLF